MGEQHLGAVLPERVGEPLAHPGPRPRIRRVEVGGEFADQRGDDGQASRAELLGEQGRRLAQEDGRLPGGDRGGRAGGRVRETHLVRPLDEQPPGERIEQQGVVAHRHPLTQQVRVVGDGQGRGHGRPGRAPRETFAQPAAPVLADGGDRGGQIASRFVVVAAVPDAVDTGEGDHEPAVRPRVVHLPPPRAAATARSRSLAGTETIRPLIRDAFIVLRPWRPPYDSVHGPTRRMKRSAAARSGA